MKRVLSLLSVLVLTACGGVNPPGPIDPPPPPPLLAQDVVVHCAGLPAEGARVYLDVSSGNQSGDANADGWIRFTTAPGVQTGEIHVDAFGACQREDLDVSINGQSHIAGGDPGPFVVVLKLTPPPPPEFPRRQGIVRLNNRVTVDDTGEFNPLGATFFPLAWAYEHDRPSFDRNLEALARAGVDYVRALAVIGGCNCLPNDAWADRPVDPNRSNWSSMIAESTDRAYDRYGIRVQWTIFGGVEFTPTPEDRRRVIDRLAEIVPGRSHKIFSFEIANEGGNGKFPGESGEQEMRALARRLRDGRVTNLIALTNADHTSACRLYGGSVANVMTVHYEREPGSDGWRSVRQPWGGNELGDACGGNVPRGLLNNEPTGPNLYQSPVSVNDPTRLAMSYVTTFVAGNGGYVLHAGPGVFLGGAWGDRPELRRKHNFDEIDGWAAIAAALRAAKAYTPVVGNCSRHNGHWDSSPIDYRPALEAGVLNRAYTSTCGGLIFSAVNGLSGSFDVKSRVTATLELVNPDTGAIMITVEVTSGAVFTLRPVNGGLIIRSR